MHGEMLNRRVFIIWYWAFSIEIFVAALSHAVEIITPHGVHNTHATGGVSQCSAALMLGGKALLAPPPYEAKRVEPGNLWSAMKSFAVGWGLVEKS